MVYGTGLSGFLGSNLVKRLKLDIENIPHELIHIVKLKPFDSFYFLSTYGNLSTHTDEKKIIQANLFDLEYILSQVNFEKIYSFVFVSSSSVKRRVQTFYSRMKKAAEELLLAYAEKYNAPISIIRPLSITGVGDQDEHLIPTLIRSCIEGLEIPFVPNAYHDYIDVQDVVNAILILSKRRVRGVFEVGTGKQWSNDEVRKMVEAATTKKAHFHIVSNMRSYDSNEWVCTNFRARQYGWEPRKSLPEIIKEMVNVYEN